MTRFLHRLAGFTVWVLFTVTGGALVYANGFNVDDGVLGLFRSQGSSFQAMGFGGVMILIVLLYIITSGSSRPRSRYISFESDNGDVSISINAVRDFVRKIGDEFGAVVHMEPQIRPEKDMISIDLNVKIQTGTRIPELSQLLQDRVRQSIRDGLGIVEVRSIKVKVQELVGAPPPSVS